MVFSSSSSGCEYFFKQTRRPCSSNSCSSTTKTISLASLESNLSIICWRRLLKQISIYCSWVLFLTIFECKSNETTDMKFTVFFMSFFLFQIFCFRKKLSILQHLEEMMLIYTFLTKCPTRIVGWKMKIPITQNIGWNNKTP